MPAADLASVRAMQELWLLLAKREWSSLAIIPAHAGGSTEEVARSLAVVGKNLSTIPVSSIGVKLLGPRSALALAAMANHIRNRQERLWHGNGMIDVSEGESSQGPEEDSGYLVSPSGRLVLGIPAVVEEPVALAVAQAVDTVVLGVELGKTSLSEVRRSIEMIGRERIAGCCLI